MKKILLVDTSFPINTRTEKFLYSLKADYRTKVLCWDRTGQERTWPSNYLLFSKRSEVGNRVKKLIYFPLFLLFGLRQFLKFKPEILLVSHWDSLVLGCLMKAFNSDVKIVYDCLDMPISKSVVGSKLLKILEGIGLHFTNLTIYASRYFPACYKNKNRYLVFENYPSKSVLKISANKPDWFELASSIRNTSIPIVSWVGVVRYPNVLENLIKAMHELDVYLFFFGDGPSLNFAKELVSKEKLSNKVLFFGRYSQKDLSLIYKLSDFIWAAYATNNINSVYAISNKFFECSLFGKVPIISSRTMMAKEHERDYRDNIILVDEFNIHDIICKLDLAAKGQYHFSRYQKVTYWEDESNRLLSALKEL